MSLICERYETAEVVKLEGPIHAQSVGELRADFEVILRRAPRVLVLDLEYVADMDSSGVGTLIWILKRMRSQGGDVRILNLHGMVRRLFQLLHLDRTMKVCETLEEAIAPAV